MEREMLTASQEKERERIKKELERLGVDEPNYMLADMKKILHVVQSSETIHTTENNIRNQKKDSSSSNNFVSDVAIKGETENERPKPSCSYKVSRNSNSELSNAYDKQNITYGRKSSSDDVSDDNTDKYQLSQKSKNFKRESHNSRMEKKSELQLECKRKLIRWQINPLDFHPDQNDVPLQQPMRPPAEERIPFKLCKDVHTIEKRIKIMNELNIHLKKMADLWLSLYGSTQMKFQWGAPIQVDTANDSLDRKPETVVSNSNEVGNVNANYNRTSKRKATWVTNTANSSSSSDDNDEISLSFLKKKRTEETSKICKTLHNKEKIGDNKDHVEQGLNKKEVFPDDNTDVSDTKADRKSVNVKTQQEPNRRAVSPEMLSNPRRTTPLRTNILDKKKTSCPLSLRSNKNSNNKNMERSPVTSRRENINNKLTDKNITEELEKDSDENNEVILNEDVVIKPLSMKNFSTRLAKQCALLKQADAERKKKILAEQEEAQRKEQEEKEKRSQDFLRRRMREMDKTYKEEEEKRRKEKEKDKWLQVLQSRNKTRMHMWKEQEKKEIEQQQKDVLLQDNDNVQIIEEVVKTDNCLEKKIKCPICNKSFPRDKIENHAAMCEQFETDSEHEQNNIYFPENNYEEHVIDCVQNKHSSLPPGYTPIPINIPDSPVRTYKPISEQKNSSIDYKSLALGSVSKTQVGRKRKH
ncbi:hypothetical protein KPH14_012550 [Odynerus spinipes]|uniref:Uncharacterized protein n=1 Tax=Odynerus spinipes TaxID=1348599 RepID=A0AAD9RJD6_9HYME|nr:hypothetical protein KPH14_012550 [Odynerus spinipes]